MVKIQLILPQKGYLTVKEDSVFPITLSVGDIRDLSKRTGTFSKTITIDGTKNNNELLNNYFDVNVVDGTFNVKTKQKCVVLEDQTVILENCYIQLLKVNNLDGAIEYEVIIKSNSSDFFQIINQKELTDLDFSDFNHVLDSVFVTGSFTNTDGFKYILPHFEGNQITVGECLPAFFSKTIFDRIFQQAGYRYEWTSLSDQDIRFDKTLIPYNGEGYENAEQEKVVLDFIGGDRYYDLDPLILPETRDDENRYDPVTGIYEAGNNFFGDNGIKIIMRVKGQFIIENPHAFAITCTNPNGATTPGAPLLKYILNLIWRSPNFDGGNTAFQVIDGVVGSGEILNPAGQIAFDYDVSFDVTATGISVGADNQFVNVFNEDPFFPQPDLPDWEVFGWYFNGIKFDVDISNSLEEAHIEIYPAQNNIYSGTIVDVNKYIPKKIKQSDWLKSIFQMYNLYVDIDKFDSNLIKLKTRDAYYDEGNIKDWTKLLAKNEGIETYFLPDIASKRYVVTYKDDQDEPNKIYKSVTNETYGQVEYVFDSEYVRETQKNELIFSPTPFTITNELRALSYIKGKTPKTNLRILYDGGMYDCQDYYVNDFIDEDGVLMSTYPLSIHFDDPYIPTFDLNFGVCDFYFNQQNSLTNNNLFNYHWRRVLGQMNNGKMLVVKFYLNALDIANLDLSDTIQIGNSFWNVNKIVDYDANSNELTKVELINIDSDSLLTAFQTRQQSNRSAGEFTLPFTSPMNVNPDGATIKGRNNNVQKQGIVIGNGNTVSNSAMVIGNDNIVNGDKSIVFGNDNTIEGGLESVIMMGNSMTAQESYSMLLHVLRAQDIYGEVNKNFEFVTRTTNATVTTLISITPDADSVYVVYSNVVGFSSATGNAIGIEIFAVFKTIAGVVTQVSTTDTVRKSNFPATVTATANTDGTVIRIRVTGQAGTTIDWKANIRKYN